MTSSILSGGEKSTKEINKGYIFFNALTISMGFMQFGYGMACWSPSQPAFQNFFDWTD